jgi:single-strand DNA-binding protein
MNNAVLVGRLTRSPEIKYVGNDNSPVTKFNIAVDRNYVSQDGEKKADFIDIEIWGRQAENCAKYLNKGSMTCVKGQIRVDRYQNSNGENRYITKVRADSVKFLGSSGARKSSNNEDANNKYFDGAEVFEEVGIRTDVSEEELPF